MTLRDGIIASRGGGMTGLKALREEEKNDHFRSLRYFNVPTGVSCGSDGVGGGSEGRCFIRHLAKPPRLICITAAENKAALNFYGPADNAAASGGRATTWALEY